MKPRETHKLHALRTILSTGSPLSPENSDYVYRDMKERVLLSSISGGTDIISCFALGNPLLPVYRGELQCRGLGMAVEISTKTASRCAASRANWCARRRSRPCRSSSGTIRTARNTTRPISRSVPNVWRHGDWAELTEHDGLIIYGRSDATLNPGGVRIGTAEIYRQVEKIAGDRWKPWRSARTGRATCA